jgi:hypothetical protein
MKEEFIIFWLFSLIIAGGVFIIVTAMRYRAKVLEMAHRERLAMIERGLKPAGSLSAPLPDRGKARSSRMMSGGIIVVGLGLAIATVIGFASREPEIAVGVGGAVAILGAAFIVTAYVKQHDTPAAEPDWQTSRRIDPPSAVPPSPPSEL